MGELLPFDPSRLPKRARQHLVELPAQRASGWDQLTKGERERAEARAVLMRRLETLIEGGLTDNAAIALLRQRLKTGAEAPAICRAATQATAGRQKLSRATLYRWLGRYREGGVEALADRYVRRQRAWHGWEPHALAKWLTPGQMNMGSVAFNLRHEGWPTATDHAVRRYLNSLPETLGARAPERVGRHYYNQNLRPHKQMDWSAEPVGYRYETDGHTLDWYTLHPLSGKPVRLELTVVIDTASHFVVGWLVWDRESAVNTLVAFSRAILEHDHVPAVIHMDPGSGFKNEAIAGDLTGFLARHSIRPSFAIAGNAKGKGLVEGWFKHLEERVGKGRDSYCGHCRTDDALRRFDTKVRRGEITIETHDQTCALIAQYVHRYNAEPQKGLDGRQSPAQVWATLERTPVELPASVVFRLSERRVVRKWTINLANRAWTAPELAEHEGRTVIVEYDPMSWAQVWVYDLQRRFIAIAPLATVHDGAPESRIEDDERRRVKGRLARIQRRENDVLAQTPDRGAHERVINEIEQAEAAALPPPKNTGAGAATPAPDEGVQGSDDDPLDLYRTDY